MGYMIKRTRYNIGCIYELVDREYYSEGYIDRGISMFTSWADTKDYLETYNIRNYGWVDNGNR